MEVFSVSTDVSTLMAHGYIILVPEKESREQDATQQNGIVTRFTEEINEALNANTILHQKESEFLHHEESFNDEQLFIEKFASGDGKDVIALNVSGTLMVTTRSTLCAVEESVLAQQFDDSKWTDQECSATRVKEWTVDDVSAWARKVEGIDEDIGCIMKENNINGCQLLAMNTDLLKMMGIERVGTLALLLKEIEKLDMSVRDFTTLIEHSPYCFDKILNFLRLKHLHACGLLASEPDLPEVCDTQRMRFENIVQYYFPGSLTKLILGDAPEVSLGGDVSQGGGDSLATLKAVPSL
jgi:hypothetical protein